MSILISADDFGITDTVNNAITECFKKGYIGRTTLMCNMPFAKEAMDIASKNDFIDKVGIHLNITAGVPKSDSIRFNNLFCNDDGVFNAEFTKNLKCRLSLDETCTKSVYREFVSQFEIYRDLGGSLWHVDSHHHVHTDASVYKALKRCFSEFPIKTVRLSRNLYRGGNPAVRVYKNAFNKGIAKDNKAQGEEYFGSFSDLMSYLGMNSLEELKHEISVGAKKYDDAVKFAQQSNIEIMVHPSFDKNGICVDITHDENRPMTEIYEYISLIG